MTRIRSELVKEKSLAGLAHELELHKYIRLGKGEELQGGRERDALLADTFEAVMGAVFLDGGFEIAKATVLRIFSSKWPEKAILPEAKDYKSRLQEVAQERFRDRPVYVLAGTSGPEHEKVFEVKATLPTGKVFTAAAQASNALSRMLPDRLWNTSPDRRFPSIRPPRARHFSRRL